MFFWFFWLGLIAAVAGYGLLPQMSWRSAVWLYVCRTVRRPMRVCLVSVTTGTIGHAFKLYKPSVNSSGSRFFASRVINIWNSLPQSTDFSRVVLMLSNDQYVVLIFFSFLSCKFVLCVCFCTNFDYKLPFFTTCRFLRMHSSVLSDCFTLFYSH